MSSIASTPSGTGPALLGTLNDDLLHEVVTWLDAPSAAAFSQTARMPRDIVRGCVPLWLRQSHELFGIDIRKPHPCCLPKPTPSNTAVGRPEAPAPQAAPGTRIKPEDSQAFSTANSWAFERFRALAMGPGTWRYELNQCRPGADEQYETRMARPVATLDYTLPALAPRGCVQHVGFLPDHHIFVRTPCAAFIADPFGPTPDRLDLRILSAVAATPRFISVSTNGSRLVTRARLADGAEVAPVQVWSLAAAEAACATPPGERRPGHAAPPVLLQWPDGSLYRPRTHTKHVLSPDGHRVLSVEPGIIDQASSIHLWNADTGDNIATFPCGSRHRTARFSQSGRLWVQEMVDNPNQAFTLRSSTDGAELCHYGAPTHAIQVLPGDTHVLAAHRSRDDAGIVLTRCAIPETRDLPYEGVEEDGAEGDVLGAVVGHRVTGISLTPGNMVLLRVALHASDPRYPCSSYAVSLSSTPAKIHQLTDDRFLSEGVKVPSQLGGGQIALIQDPRTHDITVVHAQKCGGAIRLATMQEGFRVRRPGRYTYLQGTISDCGRYIATAGHQSPKSGATLTIQVFDAHSGSQQGC